MAYIEKRSHASGKTTYRPPIRLQGSPPSRCVRRRRGVSALNFWGVPSIILLQSNFL